MIEYAFDERCRCFVISFFSLPYDLKNEKEWGLIQLRIKNLSHDPCRIKANEVRFFNPRSGIYLLDPRVVRSALRS